jgi:hypothetical protein
VEHGERPREVGVARGQPGALTVDVLAGTVDVLAGTAGVLAGTAGVLAGTAGVLAGTAGVLAGTGRLRKPASVDPAVEGRDGRSEGLDERRDRCGDAWAAGRWRCVPDDGAYLAGALGQAVEQRARVLATDRARHQVAHDQPGLEQGVIQCARIGAEPDARVRVGGLRAEVRREAAQGLQVLVQAGPDDRSGGDRQHEQCHEHAHRRPEEVLRQPERQQDIEPAGRGERVQLGQHDDEAGDEGSVVDKL